MTEYYKQLDMFSEDATRSETEAYFRKYWMDHFEYAEKWLPIQDVVFDSRATALPDQMFNPGFSLIPTAAGTIFSSEQDFKQLQECMKKTGDGFFSIIQNPEIEMKFYYGSGDWGTHPLLRFRFPVDISWTDLMSGGIVSDELFETCYKDFFVFGDNACWGRYVSPEFADSAKPGLANEVTITGFKREFSDIFTSVFDTTVDPKIVDLLPESYRTLVCDVENP